MTERLGRERRTDDYCEEWTKGESLRKHGMAVSVCTEAMEAGGGAAGAERSGGCGVCGDVRVRGTAARHGL